MKTTKEIAQLFCDEIERIGKGEVRKDVISGLEKCAGSLIKLARLEMDFAWRNWENQKPNVPWLSTAASSPELPDNSKPNNGDTDTPSKRRQDILNSITQAQKEMKKATPTLKAILEDKIRKLMDKLEVVQNQEESS